jgi:hypothetical protein
MARTRRRLLRNSFFLASLVGIAACGSSFTSSTVDPGLLDPEQPRSPTPFVSITSSGLEPIVLHRDYPVTVTFTNNDKVAHKLQSAPDLGWDDCPEMRNLGTLKPGQQLVVAFTEKDAVCAYHEASQPGNVALQGYVVIH